MWKYGISNQYNRFLSIIGKFRCWQYDAYECSTLRTENECNIIYATFKDEESCLKVRDEINMALNNSDFAWDDYIYPISELLPNLTIESPLVRISPRTTNETINIDSFNYDELDPDEELY